MKGEALRQLGDKLKTKREEKNLTLDQIADSTKINVTFLNNFEKGEFDFLPDFYIRSFFKLYLNHLGESSQSLLKQFDDLRKIDSNDNSNQGKKKSPVINDRLLSVKNIFKLS